MSAGARSPPGRTAYGQPVECGHRGRGGVVGNLRNDAGAIVKTCGLCFRVGVAEVSKELGDVVVADQAGGVGRGVPGVVRVPRVGSVAA